MVLSDPCQHLCFLKKVKELLHNIGVGDHATVLHDEDDPDNGSLPIYHDESLRNRCEKLFLNFLT